MAHVEMEQKRCQNDKEKEIIIPDSSRKSTFFSLLFTCSPLYFLANTLSSSTMTSGTMESVIVVKLEEEDEVSNGGGIIMSSSSSSSSSSSTSFIPIPPKPMEALQEMSPPPFLTKTFEMVEDPLTNSVVSWSNAKNSFVVWDSHNFSIHLLPKYFKHTNFSSFIRQLNTYGFRKVDPDRWEFANEGFLGGQKHLLRTIKRRRRVPKSLLQHERTSCLELGFHGDIDTLRRDTSMLMVEIVELQQQQHNSLQELVCIEERLQGTERKQHLMMAFLAKAFKNPSFVEKLILQMDQKNEIGGGGRKKELGDCDCGGGIAKKRRLPSSRSIEKFQGQVMAADSDIETLLSTVSDDKSNTPTQDTNASDTDLGDIMWEELLNDDLIVSDEEKTEVGLVANEAAINVEVEDLVANPPATWCEGVKELVEQLGFLGSKV
ncbi:hypothetical protein IFM89_038210 [Coptis chinensis]|uniref:HSF-type DNA-binding domain-containing protein n=1 Tax=Coptis chinensis TaxID=261450 RepID=A0A835M3G3_9MAGN|nr:hypothetical protein IFM89_038210 [Coptis chinensis]